jgi:hypothetical protein
MTKTQTFYDYQVQTVNKINATNFISKSTFTLISGVNSFGDFGQHQAGNRIDQGTAFAALYLGVSSASAQFETVAWVVGSLTVISCLMMGRSIWLLIPFLAAVNLTLRLPTTPSS